MLMRERHRNETWKSNFKVFIFWGETSKCDFSFLTFLTNAVSLPILSRLVIMIIVEMMMMMLLMLLMMMMLMVQSMMQLTMQVLMMIVKCYCRQLAAAIQPFCQCRHSSLRSIQVLLIQVSLIQESLIQVQVTFLHCMFSLQMGCFHSPLRSIKVSLIQLLLIQVALI